MQFIFSEGSDNAITAITQSLMNDLHSGKQVLWLVCGGSNIAAEVQIMKAIPDDLTDDLSIMLTDERYGEIGHKDSNWQQLLDAGFDAKSAQMFPVLNGDGPEQTVEGYAETTARLFDENDVVLAVFGIGADGHIAGVLPESPASQEATALAAGYESPPYTRLTLTFAALKQIGIAYAIAYGDTKKQALQRLQSEDIDLAEQPSQILKQLPEAYLYSDQVSENTINEEGDNS